MSGTSSLRRDPASPASSSKSAPPKAKTRKRPGTRRHPPEISQPPKGLVGINEWAPRGPFTASDISDLHSDLKSASRTKEEDAALSDAFNSAIFEAYAYAESGRQRPPPSEVLDYLNGVAREAGALLARLGASQELDDRRQTREDWFVHLRRGLQLLRNDLPYWLDAEEVVGLGVAKHVANGRKRPAVRQAFYNRGEIDGTQTVETTDVRLEVAGALLQAAPVILTLMAKAAHAGAKSYTRLPIQRGARPDVFRRMLFRQLALIHERIFGILPRTRDPKGERSGFSLVWARRILDLAAKRARERDYRGGGAVRRLANQEASTVAKQLEEASTGIRQTRANSGV